MKPFNISISSELKEKMPHMALGTIICEVENSEFTDDLWKQIKQESENIRSHYKLETIKTNKMIDATRRMYLACGKKPGRYRPAAESLLRRIVKGDELYQINTLVDLVNLVSLKTGYSIGGFDAELVEGDVVAGIGKENESYVGIGRGPLNVNCLPILRDEKGGIGTPTSDEVRTALRLETKYFFMNINGYSGEDDLNETLKYSVVLLKKHVNAKKIITTVII
ncbi:phenylalanine--tRNA ligase beta subunit-related protein [Bacteroidales bacterium]|nr:phenylalanine--tRNA ligase beta subunit-related protein [Bacteroidales bacterium]